MPYGIRSESVKTNSTNRTEKYEKNYMNDSSPNI